VRNLRLTRDTVLLTLGAIGFLHEVFVPGMGGADELIVYASLALVGLVPLLRAEEKVRRNGNGDS